VLHAVSEMPGAVHAEILLDLLLCTDRLRRPTLSMLEALLNGAPYIRVPVARRPLPPRPPEPVRKVPATGPVSTTKTAGAAKPESGVLKPAVPAVSAAQLRRSQMTRVAAVWLVLIVIVGLCLILVALTSG
jgi:hypothetical protein